MSKDDFHVIAYRILQYLYECIKKGQNPDLSKMTAEGYKINERYYSYIIYSLYSNGFIDGISDVTCIGDEYRKIKIRNDISITLQGIEYLTDNSF